LFFVDTIREMEEEKGRKVGNYLFGLTDAELIAEFSYETGSDRAEQNRLNRYLPGVVESKDVDEWTKEGQLPVVVFNAQNKHFRTKHESAASIIYAQNVAANVKDKDISQWNIIAELYTAHEDERVFPKDQPNNAMSLFAPFSDDCDHFYEIAYKTFMMVIFHNIAVTAEVDVEQEKYFQECKDQSFDRVDVFQHFDKSKEGVVSFNENVGVPFSSRHVEHNMKVIEDARVSIVADVEKFRTMISDHHRVGKKSNGWETFDLKKFEHFSIVAEFKLSTKNKEAQYLLEKIYRNLNILYSSSDEKMKNEPKTTLLFFDESKATVEKALHQEAKAAEDVVRATVDVTKAEIVVAEAATAAAYKRYNDARNPKITLVDDEKTELKFHNFFHKLMYTLDREVMPKKSETFSAFEERINEDIKEKEDKFVSPDLAFEKALESYVIKELVVLHPMTKMHSESLKSMCLGLFDAFEDAHSDRSVGRKELGDFYLLADMEPLQRNEKEERWTKGYKGPMRDVPFHKISKDHLVKDIRFHTLSKHAKAHKTVDVILKECADVKVETRDNETEIKSETVVAYKPVNRHQNSRTLRAGF